MLSCFPDYFEKQRKIKVQFFINITFRLILMSVDIL